MDVNLKGYYAVMRAAIPHMARQGGGAIVNTSSASGLGHPSHAAYATAKEGLIGLTRTAAMEVGRFGIRCNAIRPFAITEQVAEYNEHAARWRRLMDLTMGPSSTAASAEVLAPGKIAPFAVWLCADAAAGVTASLPKNSCRTWSTAGRSPITPNSGSSRTKDPESPYVHRDSALDRTHPRS
jgi:NAD(P)-dependent dehydrogenase (short-subunit alcohol dehydrogenase family)